MPITATLCPAPAARRHELRHRRGVGDPGRSGPRLTPVMLGIAVGVLVLPVVILAVRSRRDPARA